MHDLAYQLKQLWLRNKDGSFETQHARLDILMLVANQLVMLGYPQLKVTEVHRRHGYALVKLWKAEGIEDSTSCNRMAVLRWWASKVNRRHEFPNSNAAFGLEPRGHVARVSKAKTLPTEKADRIRDPYVQMSLRLQEVFGLRREESIKIKPWQADEGHQIRLQGSWTKGGRTRVVPITTAQQRQVLEEAKALVQHAQACLIPPHQTFIQQRQRYDRQVRTVGLSKMHGLRHAHFQQRYHELTGFPAPVNGGPTLEQMTPDQRQADLDARTIIATEMGHDRLAIATAYLGSPY